MFVQPPTWCMLVHVLVLVCVCVHVFVFVFSKLYIMPASTFPKL